jgi:hypothetical protein
MPRVVVAGSENSFSFAVIDFTTPATPGVVMINPGFGGGCRVAINGSNAVAGNANGGQVRLVDISNPAAPVLKGMIATVLGGINSIAMNGTRVAIGEQNGFRILLLDFSSPISPVIVSTATTTQGAFSSLAFLSSNIVVASGLNNFTCVQVDFSNPGSPTVSTFNPGLSGSPSLDADASVNQIAVGDSTGNLARLLNGATKAVIGTVNTTLPSVSVALSGNTILAGSPNAFNAARVVFSGGSATVTPFNPGLGGGSVTAIDTNFGVCGAILGTQVKLIDLNSTPPVVIGTANTSLPSISTLGMQEFTSAPSLSVSPTALAFGTVRVGLTKLLTLIIHNAGNAGLNVTNIQSSSPRFTASPAGPFAIGAGGNASVVVTFAPNAETALTANLTMQTNDPSLPTVTIPLSGIGSLPHLSISPTNLNLGSVAVCLSGTGPLTLHNTGGVDLTISSIAVTGATFSATPPNLVVAPGTTRTVTVTFTPTTTGGANGSLTITSDDPANPQLTVGLTGNGLPMPPPIISVSPTSLNFGATPLQFFIGLRVTIVNTSSCQNLAVTLNSSGTPFFVTDSDPTTLPPTTQTVSGTVASNSPKRFVVVFAPATLGQVSGVLTITSNDPAHPTTTVALIGTGVRVSPATMELVLDRSGSMSMPVPGGTKMDALKAAVHMLADLVIPGQGDEMGTVAFDDVVTILTARGTYDAAKQLVIKNDVDTLTPRNNTSIGGGLQVGQSQFSGSALARKAILVLTDGMENIPPTIAAVEPAILAAGTEVYAIGFGQPQDINAQALSTLAASSNGKFFVSDDPLILRKNFIQILADAFRQNMAADPVVELSQGQVVEIPVWITDCERRISFVLNWDEPTALIEMNVQAPDGTIFTPSAPLSNQLVRYGQRPGYRYYQIAFPPLEPGSGQVIGPARAGKWVMRISPIQLHTPTQRCTTSVFVETDLEMRASLKTFDADSPIHAVVELVHQGGPPVNSAQVRLTVTAPTRSVSQIVTPAELKNALEVQAVSDSTGMSSVSRVLITLRNRMKTVIPTRTSEYGLPLKGEGLYTIDLPPPHLDGVYQFTFQAIGQACNGTFERYTSFSRYIGRKAATQNTTITVTPVGAGGVIVKLIPHDSQNLPLGPGREASIQATVDGGKVLGVLDNLDGSYSIQAIWPHHLLRPTMQLRVDEELLEVELPYQAFEEQRNEKTGEDQ